MVSKSFNSSAEIENEEGVGQYLSPFGYAASYLD